MVLFNSKSEVNAIHISITKKLGFSIGSIDIRAQKIDGTTLNTYKMVLAAFLVTHKANQVKFFKETFLIANISLEVVIEIFFLILNSANIDFLD